MGFLRVLYKPAEKLLKKTRLLVTIFFPVVTDRSNGFFLSLKINYMRRYFNLRTFYALSIVFLALSCTKSYHNNNNATATATSDSVTSALISGKWVISSFTQQTEDKTSKFSGIVFTFSSDGSVSAEDKGQVTSGTWHFTPAVTYYGSTSKNALLINLGVNNPFDLVDKTWNLVSNSETIIKLDSPEVLEDEHVQFSRQ
jgi:hypothetical protein